VYYKHIGIDANHPLRNLMERKVTYPAYAYRDAKQFPLVREQLP